MLVVGHQQQIVCGRGVVTKVPLGIIERHRLRQDPSSRTEGGVEVLHKQKQVCLSGSRRLLKVYAYSGKPVLVYETDQRLNQARPGCFICHGAFEQCRIPTFISVVLNYRDNWHPRPLLAQEVDHPRINVARNRITTSARSVLQATPLWHQPIELPKVKLERFVTRVVPIDVETFRYWFLHILRSVNSPNWGSVVASSLCQVSVKQRLCQFSFLPPRGFRESRGLSFSRHCVGQ